MDVVISAVKQQGLYAAQYYGFPQQSCRTGLSGHDNIAGNLTLRQSAVDKA